MSIVKILNGDQVKDSNNIRWCIFLNTDASNAWDSEIRIEDILGSGHEMITADTTANTWLNYYGTDPSSPYFGIALIDWNKMRDDYNKYVTWSLINGGGTLWVQHDVNEDTYWDHSDGYDNTGMTLPSNTATISSGYTSYMMDYMLWYWDSVKDNFKYTTAYTGSLKSITVMDDRFEIEFPDNALDGKGAIILYYTEITGTSSTSVENTFAVSGTNIEDSDSATALVSGSGTITGEQGKILLYKYDSGERTKLSGAEFKLNGVLTNVFPSVPYDQTQTTGTDGIATFSLSTLGWAGSYTLSELTPPTGYEKLDDITLEIDSNGYITKVNTTDILTSNANGTEVIDSQGNVICKVSSSRLVIYVYNEIEPATPIIPTGGFELTKVNSTDSETVLPGAAFILYYIDGTITYYYEKADTDGIAIWTTDKTDAETLTTDTNGNIAVNGLEYRTYFLEETKAPTGYTLNSNPITTIVINNTTVKVVTVENTQTPAEVILTGDKTLTGRALKETEFSFTLKDSDKNIIETVENDANGDFTFSPLTFDTVGEYKYTVTEDVGILNGVTYDKTIYNVTIEVIDVDGILTATTSLGNTSNAITFNNSYIQPKLEATKTSNRSATEVTRVGDIIDYAITVKNTGDATSYDTVVSDSLPAGVELVVNSVKENGTVAPYTLNSSTNTLTINVHDLEKDQESTITFQVKVLASALGKSIENIGKVTGSDPTNPDKPTIEEPFTDGNEKPVEETLNPVIETTKVSDRTTTTVTRVGDVVTYTIQINNTGTEIATNVVLTDYLPEGLELVVGSIKVNNYTTSYSQDSTTNTFVVDLGNIQANNSVVITYEATVLESAIGKSIENTGTIKMDGDDGDEDGWVLGDTFTDNYTVLVEVVATGDYPTISIMMYLFFLVSSATLSLIVYKRKYLL